MNLRTVTIWITALLIIWTLFVPVYGRFALQIGKNEGFLGHVVFWLFFALPLIVSFILSVVLKTERSNKILFVSTIAYGIWFALIFCNVFCDIFLSGENFFKLNFLTFLIVGPLSLPVMIPAWIAAIVVEVRHRGEDEQQPE
jgi:hypothetical protein